MAKYCSLLLQYYFFKFIIIGIIYLTRWVIFLGGGGVLEEKTKEVN